MNQPAANQPLPAPLIWGETNVGKQRSHNEDQVYPDSRHKTSLRPPTPQAVQARGYLLVVADGIGGAQVGDTAANFAVRSVTDHYYADPRPLPLDKLLQSAVEVANTNVYNYVRTSPAFQQAGCTLTAAAILGNQLVVAHVGDSRAYLLQDDKLYRLTTDHNVAQMVASGQPLPGGGQGLAGNMLVRSLGAGPAVEVDTKPFMLRPGDTVLLCSDGLHSVVSDDEIKQIAGRETPEKGARKLIDLANARGGPDNISVVIARVPGSGAAAAAPAGARPSNRITALAIAVLALLGVLAVMLFVLNRPDNPPDVATSTATVEVIAALPGATLETSEPANTLEVGMATETITSAAVAVAPTSAATPRTTESRAPTSTPAIIDTPTPLPSNTPVPQPTAAPQATQKPVQSTPGLFPAPTLLEPGNGTEQRGSVSLRWSYANELRDGQQFRVLMRTENRQDVDNQWFDSGSQPSFTVQFSQKPEFFKDDGTTFFWMVVVIDRESKEISQRSEERSFVFRVEDQREDTPTPRPTNPPPEPPTATPTKLPPPDPTSTPVPTVTSSSQH